MLVGEFYSILDTYINTFMFHVNFWSTNFLIFAPRISMMHFALLGCLCTPLNCNVETCPMVTSISAIISSCKVKALCFGTKIYRADILKFTGDCHLHMEYTEQHMWAWQSQPTSTAKACLNVFLTSANENTFMHARRRNLESNQAHLQTTMCAAFLSLLS